MGRKLSKRTIFVRKMLEDGKDNEAIYKAAEAKKIKLNSSDIYQIKVRWQAKAGKPMHIRANVRDIVETNGDEKVKKMLTEAWNLAKTEFPDLKKVELEFIGTGIVIKLGEAKIGWRPL